MTKMSRAALPPRQPLISNEERRHPRFNEYLAYRTDMSNLLVQADGFDAWLRQTIERENPTDVVFRTKPGATLPQGWYKHKFGPGQVLLARLGPYRTKEAAEAA